MAMRPSRWTSPCATATPQAPTWIRLRRVCVPAGVPIWIPLRVGWGTDTGWGTDGAGTDQGRGEGAGVEGKAAAESHAVSLCPRCPPPCCSPRDVFTMNECSACTMSERSPTSTFKSAPGAAGSRISQLTPVGERRTSVSPASAPGGQTISNHCVWSGDGWRPGPSSGDHPGDARWSDAAIPSSRQQEDREAEAVTRGEGGGVANPTSSGIPRPIVPPPAAEMSSADKRLSQR
eukprot:scaffold25953_cov99-Isochrysis_galbana.AAC.3